MADVELLPLPSPQVPFIDCDPSMTDIRRLVRWYEQGATEHARANVAHATAARDAEIEALRAEVDVLKSENARIREALQAIVDEVSDGLVPYSSDSYLPAHLVEQARAALAEEDSND